MRSGPSEAARGSCSPSSLPAALAASGWCTTSPDAVVRGSGSAQDSTATTENMTSTAEVLDLVALRIGPQRSHRRSAPGAARRRASMRGRSDLLQIESCHSSYCACTKEAPAVRRARGSQRWKVSTHRSSRWRLTKCSISHGLVSTTIQRRRSFLRFPARLAHRSAAKPSEICAGSGAATSEHAWTQRFAAD